MNGSDHVRIGIVGGGMAGLVLARVLTRGGMQPADVAVFERDAGPRARSQGGSLDLHPESGQRALVAAGLIEQFQVHARPQGDEIRIVGPDGRERVRHGGSDPRAVVPDADGVLPGRPEIDRARLRALLLDSLPDGVVRWGSQVVGVSRPDAGGHRVGLADGSAVTVEVLVGADGGRSAVRRLLTPVEATPIGVTIATLRLRGLSARPDLVDLIGSGSLWGLGGDTFCGAQRGGDDDARVSVHARDAGGRTRIAVDATKAELLALLDDWAPVFHRLVEAADDEVDTYRLATTPIGMAWSGASDLTLVGDAAHLMPPVGEGANQAMLDGAELGRALLASPGDAAAAIATYEAGMQARIRPVAEESQRIQSMLLAPDALETMVGFFSRDSVPQ